MYEAVLYEYLGQMHKSYFNNPAAKLPIIASFERIKFVSWGRRELEPNTFPVGSTLFREDILNGKYDSFSPISVRISVIKFLEKDNTGIHHWYEIINGLMMQGVILNYCDQLRAYVVTIRSITPNASYNSWPRLLYKPDIEFTNNHP